MTSSNPPNFSRQILLLTAGIFLLAAPQGVLAKRKDHSDDHSGMSSNDSSEDHGDKPSKDPKNKVSEKHKGKHKEESADNGMDSEKQKSKHKDKESAENGTSSEKHKGKNKEQAEKTTDTEQDKTTPGTVPTANGNTPTADGDLFGKGIAGRKGLDGQANASMPAPGAAPGPTAVDTIHPIPTPAAGPGNGMVRITDQNGNTMILPDHGAGVTVTNAGPGKVTISNGVDSLTVRSIDVTISGAKTVSVDKSLGTGPRRADGAVNVLTPNGTVTNTPVFPGGGFEAGPNGQK